MYFEFTTRTLAGKVFLHKVKETIEFLKLTASFLLPDVVCYKIANPWKYYYDSSPVFLLSSLQLSLLVLPDSSLGILSHISCFLLQLLLSAALLALVLTVLHLGGNV